jgi:hypothetical protein
MLSVPTIALSVNHSQRALLSNPERFEGQSPHPLFVETTTFSLELYPFNQEQGRMALQLFMKELLVDSVSCYPEDVSILSDNA